MRRNRLTLIIKGFKALAYTMLLTGSLWSCQEEKPVVDFQGPDPVIPQKEFIYLESLSPDTISFNEGDSTILFRVQTIPFDLLSRDSLNIQVSDSTGIPYSYAGINSYELGADSIWSIMIGLKQGANNGDAISIMVGVNDTVLYSGLTVINMIPKPVEPEPVQYSINLLNDSITAFLSGGNAVLRVSTVPWDLMSNDSINFFALTDTTGDTQNVNFNIVSMEFQPDSTWNVTIKPTTTRIKDEFVKVMLSCPDTVLVSRTVNVKRVSFRMNNVYLGNGVRMNYSSSTETYSYCVPTVTDFSNQLFSFNHTGDKVTLGDSIIGNETHINANKPIVVSVWKYDVHKDYTLKMTNTGLPVVRITTPSSTMGMADFDRSTWVPGIAMRIEWPDGKVDYEGTMSMKGRGNGTWTEPKIKTLSGQRVSKRPYGIRLDEKAKILGMHKQKRWILLANFKDRTLLRNDAAYWLSRNTEMPYTVNGQFVELVWNGVHVGNYYLCEQARIDDDRINIANPNLTDPEKGGFFMEIDTYYNYGLVDRNWADKGTDIGFWSSRFKMPYIFKDPDDNEIDENSAAYNYMVNYVTQMENAIYNASNTNHQYEKYLDVDRAIDFLLIQEITQNHDAYNTWPSRSENPNGGPHSAFLYKDSCGLMCFGPMWDFDYHTFMPTCNDNGTDLAKEWVILKTRAKTSATKPYYFEHLFDDNKFKKRMVERWNMYKNNWKTGFPAYVDQMASKIRTSESYNWSIWGSSNPHDINPNGDQNQDLSLTFQQAVDRMKQGFSDRWDWLDTKMTKYQNELKSAGAW